MRFLTYHSLYSKQNTPPMLPSPLREETQIYDDVSTFIQVFKRAVAACEVMQANSEKGSDNTQAMTLFCELFEEIKGLSQRYAVESLCGLQPSAFSRFVHRLVEVIAGWRLKYRSKREEGEHTFQKFLKQLEAYLRECEKRKSFLSLVNCTQIILLKFANRILVATRSNGEASVQTEKIMQIGKRLREELGRLKDSSREVQSKGSQSQRVIQQEETDLLQEKKERFNVANRIFLDMQQRFDKFKGIDLDFAYFRASYFEAKNNFQGFYHHYCQRNQQILNAIASFSQLSQAFAKRRELKSDRQRKLLQTQKLHQTTFQKMALGNTKRDHSEQAQQGFKEALILPFNLNSSRVSGKLKSIYINLGRSQKIKQNQDDPSPSISSQTHHNNKKNKTSEGEKPPSFLFDSSYYNRQRQRIKTSPNQKEKQAKDICIESEAKMPHQKVFRYVFSPKIQIKSKCFQMGNIPSTAKSQAKNKIFPINKFSIRQADKNKLVNWFSQK